MEGWTLVSTLVATLLGGGLIGVVFLHRRELPKALAAARKTDAETGRLAAETDDLKIAALERQLGRLDERVEMLESEIAECHQDRDLALAAARFLWDRLRTAAPDDEAVERLRQYLHTSPTFSIPRDMKRRLDDIE